MKIAFITRSTLYKVQGGGAVQVIQTARHLEELGVKVSIYLSHEKINYNEYDLLHFFDIIRPANILYHIKKTTKPYVISPILVDYSEYDKQHRKGISGMIFSKLPASFNEYLKTITRWLLGKDKLQSKAYIWKGHQQTIREILKNAEMILPNSNAEYARLKELHLADKPALIVPNGINEKLFQPDNSIKKDEKLVICAARIEGIKNQLNLIKALNNTEFRLLLIGDPSPNQKGYFKLCREAAATNIEFISNLSQNDLVNYYKKAKVHVLPSWFETCGLSSLEAAAMGCNLVITDKGFTKDYYGEYAFYCDPDNKESIYAAIVKASQIDQPQKLQQNIIQNYTWQKAAAITLEAYKKIINHELAMPAVQ